MSDIVERLRRTKPRSAFYKDDGRELINPDGTEAADEIERLRKAAKGLLQFFPLEEGEYPRQCGFSDAVDDLRQALKDTPHD